MNHFTDNKHFLGGVMWAAGKTTGGKMMMGGGDSEVGGNVLLGQ